MAVPKGQKENRKKERKKERSEKSGAEPWRGSRDSRIRGREFQDFKASVMLHDTRMNDRDDFLSTGRESKISPNRRNLFL